MVPAMAFFGPWYVVALGGLAFGLGLHALTSTSVPASIRLGQPSSHAVLVALLSPVVLYGVGGALTFARIVRIGRPELYGAAWLVHCALLTGGWIALHGATLVALFLAAQSMA